MIIEWEWWRLRMGSCPRRVWDMNDPHVAGGMAELYNWNTHPNYHLWPNHEKPFEVRWWKPAYHTSVITVRRFATIEKAYSFYMKLRNRRYVERSK